MKGYSLDTKKYNENALAKAKIESINMSWKDAVAVCDAIRNKSVKEAMLLLDRVEKMEIPIYYRTHNKKMGHRKELNGKKGRWPVKVAGIIKKLVKSLTANAINKGLDETSLVIIHASANKKATYPKLQPVGRRVRHDYETARVELIALDTSYQEEKVKERREKIKKIQEEKERIKKQIEEAAKKEHQEAPEKAPEKKEEKAEKTEKKEKKEVKKEKKEKPAKKTEKTEKKEEKGKKKEAKKEVKEKEKPKEKKTKTHAHKSKKAEKEA